MRKFKTESQKLLDLMINSIYTNKEIFLRELISNASDAIDKLYFKSLTDSSIEVKKEDLEIHIDYDSKARVLTVSDNGLGMTKDELDLNLGTIAHSDSQAFKTENAEAQAAGEDLDIIGQFGVGFYSAFMVASQVRVVSRSYGSEEAYAWESDGRTGYEIEASERLNHGTDVILIMKQDDEDEQYSKFCTEEGLLELIEKYSNYVRYPIRMKVTNQRQKPKPENAGDDYVPEWETYTEVETVNSMVPIWKRSKSDVTEEELNQFYRANFRDFNDPVRHFSVHAEGAMEYDALLFFPKKPAYNFYTRDYQTGLQLYSSNVLIMDRCPDLLPRYFSFVNGVVDSQDLHLNISRETLQQNSQLRAIERRVEKKIKQELENMRDDSREDYEKLFEGFGRVMKFGLYEGYGRDKDVLADLLMFYSAKQEKMITFDEYIDACGDDQKTIYYATGDSLERIGKLPIVTSVLSRGYDVLLCEEDIDEFCLQVIHDYKDFELKNVATGDLGLETEEEKAEAETVAKDNSDLFDAMKDALEGAVSRVSVSTRLTDAPACLTAGGDISLEMEKVMAKAPGEGEIKSERVLEINPKHQVFSVLQAAHTEGDKDKVAQYATLLYNQALLIEGMPIDDPIAFAKSIADLMV